jgi:hypothetical protein
MQITVVIWGAPPTLQTPNEHLWFQFVINNSELALFALLQKAPEHPASSGRSILYLIEINYYY